MNSLQVLFLTSWYPNNKDPQEGIFVKKLALAAALHHDVELIYVTFNNELRSRTKRTDQIGRLSETIIELPPEKGIKKILTWRKTYVEAINELNDQVDLVHVNIAFPIAGVLLNSNILKRVPVVYSESWSGFVNGSRIPFHKLTFQRWLAKRSNLILPVSEFLKSGMIQAGVSGNFEILGNVVDFPQDFTQQKQIGSFRFVVVADLKDDIKNISGIIHAFSRIKLENCELHILGDGQDLQRLQTLAKNTRSAGIEFHGRKTNDEVLDLLPAFDACIINSNFETFSVVCLEAVASRVPVIVTKCGGPQDFFNESMGLEIEVGNLNALERAMRQMIAEPTKITEDTVQSIKDQYSPTAIGASLKQLYERVLKG